MEVRITFRSEIYIKGENEEEIRKKFENLPLFTADALDNHAEFVEETSFEIIEK